MTELDKELQTALLLMEQRLTHSIARAIHDALSSALQDFAETNNAGMLAAQKAADEGPMKRWRDNLAATCYLARLRSELKDYRRGDNVPNVATLARLAVQEADQLLATLLKTKEE